MERPTFNCFSYVYSLVYSVEISAYEQAMQAVADNKDRQLVSVALAMCDYASKNIDSAKSVLFKR